MIKLFRSIRKALLTDGKFSKYLLYALGEIILVVIGILIALSINNWNEDRKTNNKLRSTLTELKNDLIRDTVMITRRLPFITQQYDLNESLRARVAAPGATIDTLVQIMRFEFNPNWTVQVPYNSNTYNSLIQLGLLENLPGELKANIKDLYTTRAALMNRVERTTNDYQGKVTSYVNTYTFGVTEIHDQGPLIDSLVWQKVDFAHLAATFQGISNFKRILFTETRMELEFSLGSSRELITQISDYLNESSN